MKKLLDETLWKFLLVGVLNTLVGTAVMFLCYNLLHWGYWISSAMNYVVGSILSFVLNRSFTFRDQERSIHVVLRFILSIGLCYLVAYGAARPLAARLLSGFSMTVRDNGAMLAGMCLFVALNYLGQRFFVFRNRRDPRPEDPFE